MNLQVLDYLALIYLIIPHACVAVLECNPAMDCAKDLLKELNQTNDWSKFILNMRNMFRTEFS
jgi:hypothetical protein